MLNEPSRAILAANIVRLRAARGWSQEMLAFECGLHRTFIAHVEKQKRNISIDNIDKIALALSVEPFALLQKVVPLDDAVNKNEAKPG